MYKYLLGYFTDKYDTQVSTPAYTELNEDAKLLLCLYIYI